MTRSAALSIARAVLLLGALGHVAEVAGDDTAVIVPAGGLRDPNVEKFQQQATRRRLGQQDTTGDGNGALRVRALGGKSSKSSKSGKSGKSNKSGKSGKSSKSSKGSKGSHSSSSSDSKSDTKSSKNDDDKKSSKDDNDKKSSKDDDDKKSVEKKSKEGGKEDNDKKKDDKDDNDKKDNNNNNNNNNKTGDDKAKKEDDNKQETKKDEGEEDEEKKKEGTGDDIVTFDIKDCASYSTEWMFDLAGTCDEKDLESEIANTANCKCADTLRLIKLGDIDCMLDECPTDCQVCDLCLKVSC
mmetsp:Transcript_36754/g.80391  ORF Transcript_36754/g.80391 Transcript_36754/m.80391 type:complete len:298 (+) Transcript_36754:158-1051(+)